MILLTLKDLPLTLTFTLKTTQRKIKNKTTNVMSSFFNSQLPLISSNIPASPAYALYTL